MRLTSGVSKIAVGVVALLFLSIVEINSLAGSDTGVAGNEVRTYSFDFETVRAKGPKLNLRSAILVNFDNGEVLYAKNAELVHPIASISKLVAAMVILDKIQDFTARQTVTKEDAYRSSFSHLRPGYEMTLDDLLHTALMISDNRATRALARAAYGTYDDFAQAMNEKCKALGLEHTVFFDPTGLDARNVSTAHEVAIILHHAYAYPKIAEITSSKQFSVFIKRGRRNYMMQLRNTNHLMDSPYHVLAGKTGYIEESAYCLTTIVQNAKGEKLTLVVLGSPSGGLRFREARKLANWGFTELANTPPAPMATTKEIDKQS